MSSRFHRLFKTLHPLTLPLSPLLIPPKRFTLIRTSTTTLHSTMTSSILDKQQFTSTLSVVALRVAPKDCHIVAQALRAFTLRRRGVRTVTADPSDTDNRRRLVLLDPERVRVAAAEEWKVGLPEDVKERLMGVDAKAVRHDVALSYDNLSCREVLRKVLPEGITDVPSSYETVGHVAHMNLREELLPYKRLIGEVVLDKHKKTIRTVVNKSSTIASKVIAGEEDYMVQVKEHNAVFAFNFAEVYWNSRLQEEHQVLVRRFKPGQVVVDAMCGVGPFVIPAAMKGCKAFANDLNPKSYKYLLLNIKKNKVQDKIKPANVDAMDYIRQTARGNECKPNHIVLNLPASAPEFLGALRGSFSKILWKDLQLPMVHCYSFSKAPDAEGRRQDVISRAEKNLGASLGDQEVEVRVVRDVAPNKLMMCLHFRVPKHVAFAETEEPVTKKQRT